MVLLFTKKIPELKYIIFFFYIVELEEVFSGNRDSRLGFGGGFFV